MKPKVNEEMLIAYLYGECSAEEKVIVEKYLAESPEEARKYKDILFVKNMLGKVSDKEVIAPPIFMDDGKPEIGFWRSGFVRYVSGIAATFLLVIIGAKLLGLQMNYSDNQFTLSFGPPTVKEVSRGLSQEDVQSMISKALDKNNAFVEASWEQSQNKMDEAIRKNTLLTSHKINEINRTSSQETQDQIRRFMEKLQSENTQAFQEYIRLTTSGQQRYIENLLVDFSKYMQEQRNQDLNLLNARLNSMEEDNTQFRQEAGQILTSLVSNENPAIKRN